MAWLDDRIWCHPKTADLSSAAGWTWVKGIAYSSGMGTGGRLTAGQQKLVGGVGGVRRELVAAGLWEENGADGTIDIHDWDEHNGKRDARRAADRERKRLARGGKPRVENPVDPVDNNGTNPLMSAGTSAGQSTGTTAGASAGTARVDGSEGSDGSRTEGSSPYSLPPP